MLKMDLHQGQGTGIFGRPPRFFFFSMRKAYHTRKIVDKYLRGAVELQA